MAKKPKYWWSRDMNTTAKIWISTHMPVKRSDDMFHVEFERDWVQSIAVGVFAALVGFIPRKGTCGKVADLHTPK